MRTISKREKKIKQESPHQIETYFDSLRLTFGIFALYKYPQIASNRFNLALLVVKN